MATKQADNRYSNVTYNQTVYGASAPADYLAWGLDIDWNDDGLFSGSNEAYRMVGISIDRGKKAFVKPRGDGFETQLTGTCRITLDNGDGRYDAWNVSSPLYPYVTYGHDVRVRVRDMSTGTTYPVFYGVINDIKPIGYGTNARVTLEILDNWSYLRSVTARVALQTDVTPETALGLILDSISWPSRWGRTIGVSGDDINYWWASGNKVAGAEIEELTQSFLSYFVMAADGKARYTQRADFTAGSVYDYDQSELLKDMTLPQPWETSRNIVRIKTHPRTVASTGTIWQLVGDTPSIASGQSITLWANYTYSGAPAPAVNVITPAATTDYTANTQSDGGGTDKTADIGVSFTDFGDTAKIVITNGSAGLVYITLLKVRGDAVYEVNEADVTYPTDTSTVTQPRELRLDLIWQQDTNVATDFTAVLGPFFATNQKFPAIKIESRPAAQFSPDLSDIVTLTVDKLGILGEVYRVSGISHRSLTQNCQAVETTLYLEPYIFSETGWTWDIADFGTDTVFGA